MYESFPRRSCVSSRMDRKPSRVIVRMLSSLMICLCLACPMRRDAGAPCPVIEMNAIADTQTDSTRTVVVNDTATVLMSRTPLAAAADITGATASQDGDHWVLSFTVTEAAATRVREFTAQNVGRQLALVADGKVKATPRIAGAIAGNSYQIEGFDQADAERLATAFTNGCRR